MPSVLIAAALGLAIPRPAGAASVEWDLQPRAVVVGESAICTVTIRGVDNPPAPVLPAVPGLQINAVGTERSWSVGPGGQDSTVGFRFQILPLQTGRFTLGPLAYQVGGATVELPAIELHVVDQARDRAAPQGQPHMSDLLFAVLRAQPTNLYVQQVFDVVLSVYSRNLNLGRDIELGNLPASGISFTPFQEIGSGREVVHNQIYDVRRFRCKAQALTSGRFTLNPNIRVQVVVPRDRRRMSPFEGFFEDPFADSFFGRVQTQPVDLRAPEIALEVRPLPPADGVVGFGGAVGRFAFDAQVRPTEVAAGEPVTLSMQITGEGNIESVSPPAPVAGPNFRWYEPRLVARELDPARAAGRMMYEQVVIPRSTTNGQLPALSFSYFDPEKERYETITRGPFLLTVHPATNVAGLVVQAPAGSPETRTLILGTDIVYLKPAPARWPVIRTGPSDRTLLRAFHALPALALLGVFLAARRREQMSRDVARARRLRAPRVARPALRRAEQALARADRPAFADALREALDAYLGNRLNLPPGALTPDVIMSRLEQSGLSPEWRTRVQDLLTFCDQERYGRGTATAPDDQAALAARLDLLRGLLKAFEKARLR